MKVDRHFAFQIVSILMLACCSGHSQSETKPAPLTVVADIPVPGPAVRFDYQSLDSTSGRLYISHMNANQLMGVRR